MGLIRKLGLKKPIIDCLTRWILTLNVLTRLIELKDFTEDFLSDEGTTRWTGSMWAQAEILVQSFPPAQEAIKIFKANNSQFIISMVYGWRVVWGPQWYRFHLHKLWFNPWRSESEISAIQIFFHAALYLDHRYRLLLSTDQKCQAKMHLSKT